MINPGREPGPSLRGVRGASFYLLTPDNRYGSALPQWPGAGVFKLATPRTGSARFGQYLLDLPAGGGTSELTGEGFEHFLYVLRGMVGLSTVGAGLEAIGGELKPGGFAYLPEGCLFTLTAGAAPAQLLWLKRRYEPPGVGGSGLSPDPPPPIIGDRADHPRGEDLVPGVSRQELLASDDPRRDFTMSVLRFAPGAGLPNIEIHDEEHGLYMLRGAGLYHLEGAEHRVGEGDFIYMAPYCPQSFVATGGEPAEYLLYKDVFRDGF